ncbi:uncharacterized protein LOC123883181 [Trifolium pratense]|uniref:uncharacterized protein LOC123883181 n=1 Tax=Trifolium pratense TaxID=57577 RepID=UPI001E693D5D|nr:uncharacterized protein LOC123883181 [Trifolium pratense]
MPITVDHVRFANRDLYDVNLHGTVINVIVTAAASVVRRWINSTLSLHRRDLERNCLIVGLGVQWTPCGRNSPADTLQLCIGRRCLILQLFHANRISTTLRTFLRNPDFTFVGFWNHSDRRKLESSEHRFEMCRDPLDLRYYAVAEDDDDDQDLSRAPIHKIVEKYLGYDVELELSREIGRSDWDDEYLSHDQVVYASIDAYCAFRIGKNTKAWRYI